MAPGNRGEELRRQAETPRWLEDADASTGFGGPSYKFTDLPRTCWTTKPLGVKYLQFWWEMMFGDADYHIVMWPNPAMGTPEQLRESIAKVHRQGGRVGFYYLFTVADPVVHLQFEKEKYRGKAACLVRQPLVRQGERLP